MSAAHTPGPWRWMNNETLVADHGRRPAILTAYGQLVTCAKNGLLRPLDVDEPNARLIAASPELLELLKTQRERLGDGRNVEGWVAEWLEEIDAAIAKAEGSRHMAVTDPRD